MASSTPAAAHDADPFEDPYHAPRLENMINSSQESFSSLGGDTLADRGVDRGQSIGSNSLFHVYGGKGFDTDWTVRSADKTERLYYFRGPPDQRAPQFLYDLGANKQMIAKGRKPELKLVGSRDIQVTYFPLISRPDGTSHRSTEPVIFDIWCTSYWRVNFSFFSPTTGLQYRWDCKIMTQTTTLVEVETGKEVAFWERSMLSRLKKGKLRILKEDATPSEIELFLLTCMSLHKSIIVDQAPTYVKSKKREPQLLQSVGSGKAEGAAA